MWKFISNEPNENESQSEATEIHYDSILNKNRNTYKNPTKYTHQRKRKNKLTIGTNVLMTSGY